MRLLDNDDVRSVLDMRGTITALRRAYDDLRDGEATYVPRIDMFAPTGRPDDYYQWGSMAGVSMSYGIAAVRIKSDVVSWQGGTHEKYCVRPGRYCGLILCFRVADGAPLAILQDGYLQHMRVGADGGIGWSQGRLGVKDSQIAFYRHRTGHGNRSMTDPDGAANFAFCDGHVSLLASKDLADFDTGKSRFRALWSEIDPEID